MKKIMTIDSDKINKFIDFLAACGNIKKSAEAANIPYPKIFIMKKSDPEFREKMDEALSNAAVILEDEARRRAIEGVEEPILYKGEITGSKIKYSDALLLALLKAHYPEKYAEKTINMNIDIGKMLDDALNRLK